MKNLFLSAIFAVVTFTSNAQIITAILTSQKTYFKISGSSSRLTTFTNPSAVSNTELFLDTNLVIIDLKSNTMTLKGSKVYYEEIVEISNVSENFGSILFYDETNGFDYVIDLNKKTVQRFFTIDGNSNLVVYETSKIIEQ